MKAKIFVKELNLLIKENNHNSLNNEIVNRMTIIPQKHQIACRDELSSLINNYQMEDVEIGLICFFGEYKVTQGYLLFGKIEMDLLSVDRNTKEIVLLDHDNLDYVMTRCTKSSTEFIELLYLYSKFILNRLSEDPAYNLPPIDTLCQIGGGNTYRKFVEFLFTPLVPGVSPTGARV